MTVTVGFTGTRSGMSDEQTREVRGVLMHLQRDREISASHHGDCLGADEQFDEICIELGIYRVAHPPTDTRFRAFCQADEILDALPYIERNHVIVDTAELMLATPHTHRELLRSGTWATVRYAEQSKVPYFIIYPNGRFGRLYDEGIQP